MRPNAAARQVSSGGVTASGSFGISRQNEAHIMNILRDTLYSDKVLAVLREYSANAWDANRAAGKHTTPIKVTLPTEMDPNLRIRDYGPGISPEDIFAVYTQYGESTKRDTDDEVGFLGIGSKSGFAYSDSFTVTSRYEGWKRTYVAVLDESNKGMMSCLHEEACDFEDSGVEVQIAVRTEDVDEFESKAQRLFKHFDPRPEINTELEEVTVEQVLTDEGLLWRENYSNDWTAVMGCVPYEVDISEIVDKEIGGIQCGDYIRKLSGILYFKISEVEISASRERLKYSNKTKLAVIQKINHVVDEYVRITLERIRSGKFSPWEKRVRAQILNELKLPIPDELKEDVKDIVKIDHPVSFFIVRRGSDDLTHTEHVCVTSETRLLLKDDTRTMKGFDLEEYDYVVTKREEVSWDVVTEELNAVIDKAGLFGIPVRKLSELSWTPPPVPYKKQPKKVNVKHKVRTFRLVPSKHFGHPWSGAWEAATRVPTEEDVYVILDHFRCQGTDVYVTYKTDKELLEEFSTGPMPTIYGYKTTDSKPVDKSKLVGKSYEEWRRDFMKGLCTPEVEKEMNLLSWSDSCERSRYYRQGDGLIEIADRLGRKHPITNFMGKEWAASKRLRKLKWERRQKLKQLMAYTDFHKKAEVTLLKKAIDARYPLFGAMDGGIGVLWQTHGQKWAEYVHLIDRIIPVAQPQEDIPNIFDEVFPDKQEPEVQEETES